MTVYRLPQVETRPVTGERATGPGWGGSVRPRRHHCPDHPRTEGPRAMALAQPDPGRLLPERPTVLRGGLATTSCMETLQVGYLHAVAAAAGCSLSQPFPDNGIDLHLSHSSHTPRG